MNGLTFQICFAYIMAGSMLSAGLYCAVEGKLNMEIFFMVMAIYWKIMIQRLRKTKDKINGIS